MGKNETLGEWVAAEIRHRLLVDNRGLLLDGVPGIPSWQVAYPEGTVLVMSWREDAWADRWNNQVLTLRVRPRDDRSGRSMALEGLPVGQLPAALVLARDYLCAGVL